jgi:hypothetical protein
LICDVDLLEALDAVCGEAQHAILMALAKRLQQYWHDQGCPAARFWTEPLDERFANIGTYEVATALSR